MKKFLQKQIGRVFSGIIIWLPIVIIATLAVWMFKNADSAGKDFLGLFPFGKSLPSGTGFLAILLFLYLSGIIFKKTRVRNLAAKIPVVGNFLGQKDGKTMTPERLFGLRPCLFLFSPTCPAYGFILSKEKVVLGDEDEEARFTMLSVYRPDNPTIFLGQTYLVRKETVIRLGNSPKEIIDLILYGSRSPENVQYLPWEGEMKEEFKKRAEGFGINPDTEALTPRR